MRQSLCTITSNVEISAGVRLMWVEAPNIAIAAQPGQFITARCEDFILRRPLSIHQVSPLSSPSMGEDLGEGEIALLFQVVGGGTAWLSQRQVGDKIDILGPLGKGFSIPSVIAKHEVPKQSKNLLLVAGGIGIAPLTFLAQRVSPWHQVTLIHGASTAAQIYPLSSLNKVRFIPVTEDGSTGEKGVVTDILPDSLDWADQIYACGPVDMYKAMATMSLRAERSNLKKCQVSLEVRLGCGIGACYGCTIPTKKGLKKVCQDGPVFELDDILWEEVRI